MGSLHQPLAIRQFQSQGGARQGVDEAKILYTCNDDLLNSDREGKGNEHSLRGLCKYIISQAQSSPLRLPSF